MTVAKALTIGLVLGTTLATSAPAAAQTEGRVSIGGSITFNSTTDADVDNALSIGPLIRLNPRRGWGVATALNWFRADLQHPSGVTPFARLQVRPLMGGIGYTFGPARTLFNVSIVAGPSFNSAEFDDDFIEPLSSTPSIEADTSFAVRPGFSLTQTLAPRVGLTAFAGYMINRPKVVYRAASNVVYEDRWRADAIVLSVGLVYSIF
jgi:outer membrane protein with beta-barrel domain